MIVSTRFSNMYYFSLHLPKKNIKTCPNHYILTVVYVVLRHLEFLYARYLSDEIYPVENHQVINLRKILTTSTLRLLIMKSNNFVELSQVQCKRLYENEFVRWFKNNY